MSFIAFKIKAEDPPLEIPISTTFFGLIALISPLRNFSSSGINPLSYQLIDVELSKFQKLKLLKNFSII
jgi:hypothetical protein